MTTNLIEASPWLVTTSATNPRKRRGLDIDSLNALATSIRAQGVLQPILVRPLPAGRLHDTFLDRELGRPLPEYELVAGERRLRASRIADLDFIPILVRDLSDEAALELQLVENIEREDLDPMEEAEGFELLRERLGYTVEQIAERIGGGKGASYIYKTMKLLDLTPDSREAVSEGVLGRSTGLLVSRYPASQQADVVAFIRALAEAGEPAPFRKVSVAVFKRFNLDLKQAVWDIQDASLLPDAGACSACPKRSGAHGDLFGDATDSPDSCTDPDCFAAKREAHVAIVKAKAQKDGFKVIEGEEAHRVRPSPHQRPISGYVRLTDVAATETGDDGVEREVTFEDKLRALGKRAPKPRVFIDPHTGAAEKVITTDLADKLQPTEDGKPSGKGKTAGAAAASPGSTDRLPPDDGRTPAERALDDHNVQRAVLLRMLDAIRTRERSADELRLALKLLLVEQEGCDETLEYMGFSGDAADRHDMETWIDALLPAQLGQLLAMSAVEIGFGEWDTSIPAATRVKLAESYGIDVIAVRDKVAEDLQREEAKPLKEEQESEEAST
ncbi:ParB/RepB/Spo0J family partition protein [Ramlibacter sp. Leaf400]|uniref:ParB/RepB/Spo0J family partition protein n=1 Tax=Ramlibacter sp. Leaf400 TaxID=1736365 RepID=UPI0006FC614D|nr:ParB/RepB/Spo0J family partition protein [Ramlibacter sp. Leaf400]KQT10987.1 hypothetical protein ASG30_09315 [Ramlibacter sp. Leaf400]